MSNSAALCLALTLTAVAIYSCGSSDEKVNAQDSGAGQGGEQLSGGGSGAAANAGEAQDGGRFSTGGMSEPSAGVPGAAGEMGAVAGQPTGGADGGGGGGGGAGGAGPVVLPDGLITDVPYTCASPFDGVEFEYFHLEDFEDSALSTPGVTANTSTLSSSFGGGLTDSIDCDDGVVDGVCAGCDALYGNGTIEVTFDAQALGALPTHVGLVWTDGGAGSSVTITGYDATDGVIYSETVQGIGDGSIYGTVEEDRFFGIVHYAGVRRVVIVNSTGGVEIDHLQYGR